MPIFQYKGYKTNGINVSGTLEAGGLQEAISNLKSSGVYPKDIREHDYRGKRWFLRRHDKDLLPSVTRQLSTLLSAGVPLIDALKSLSEENKGFWRSILISVREKVSGGASLSRALEDYQDIFPPSYINMVSAGEHSGTLDNVLVSLADFLENEASIKAKIKTAMIYPLFMMSVGFIVMSFLFVFVIPKIVGIFEDTDAALPFITVILITVSNLFVSFWWVFAAVAVALFWTATRLNKNHRYLIDKMRLKMPGNIVQNLYLTRFARTLGLLLGGGLPMLKGLEQSAKSTGNLVLEENIKEAAKKVAEGAPLSASLVGLPPVFKQLIATGEKSGRLVEVLTRAADSCEEEFGRRVQKALSFLEPLMILLMGFAVGFIVLAVLLPMFELNQLVR